MRRLSAIVFSALFFGAMAESSFAFDFSSESQEDKIDRLERALNTLERQVYKGTPRPANGSTIAEQPSDDFSPVNPEIRITEMENKIRELTGAVEELQFEMKKISEKLGTASPAATTSSGLVSENIGTSSSASTETSNEKPKEQENAIDGSDGTRVLGVIPAESDPVQSAEPQGPKADYDAAFDLLRKSKYAEAADAFNEFIKKYPSHELLSNAYYWLGEAFLVQKDYEQSSVAFLQGYQTDNKGAKASDNLLKLAISLKKLGKKKESCATLAKLEKEFPSMTSTVRKRMQSERKEASCK